MKRKRYRYLYRLTLIIFLMLALPVILITWFFWNRSFEEMRKGNEAYYEKMTESFMNGFNRELTELKDHASRLSVGSRKTDSAFFRGEESFQENAYWYYEAVEELKENANFDVSDWGIYYYGIDSVITRSGNRPLKQYVENTLLQDGGDAEQAMHFFSEGNYRQMKMVFATTNTADSHEGKMLAGYCTTLGSGGDKALIFYVIDPQNYKDLWNVGYDEEGVYFYVLNSLTDQVFLAFGDAAGAEELRLEETERTTHGIRQKVLYQSSNSLLPLSFAVYVTEDSLQNNITEFYQNMRLLSVFLVLFLLALCVAALYMEYRPVHRLLAGMENYEEYEGGEFETIQNALHDRSVKIQEQEMLVLDLLVSHLLYGVPVSAGKLERLVAGAPATGYCVYLLEGHVLLSSEASQFAKEAEKQFSARLFVTDLQEEDQNVIIAFLKEANAGELEAWMEGRFRERFVSDYSFYPGKVVESPDEIRSSYLYCCEKKKERETKLTLELEDQKAQQSRKEQQKKKRDEILAYLEAHYRDTDLSQTQVADAFQISSYTLSRMFKSQVGIGFTEYVNAKRLDYAKELLLTTSYSIREISILSGFGNDNYFSRIFKASTGVSPTRFREG